MLDRAMNSQKLTPPKPSVEPGRARRHEAERAAVLRSLIVCPHGGFAHRRHGMGAASARRA
jgi:hypothetical protein